MSRVVEQLETRELEAESEEAGRGAGEEGREQELQSKRKTKPLSMVGSDDIVDPL